MSEDELLDLSEESSWEPKENESRGKIRKYKCDCLDDIELGTTIGGWGFDELTEVTKENIEEVKARAKKECNLCGGTGVAKFRKMLAVRKANFVVELESKISPSFGNVRFSVQTFALEEQEETWDYNEKEWVGDGDYDEELEWFNLTWYPEKYKTHERFTFDGADIIRLFELKGYDFDDTNEDWWTYNWESGQFYSNYAESEKYNFEEEDDYETRMKKWESFKGSFKNVSSADHFYYHPKYQ